jgi:RNA polymerase sigma-70 factor (ECF subfamily)
MRVAKIFGAPSQRRMSTNPALMPDQLDCAALVVDLRPALVRFFRRRCKCPGEAEDLAQDVIVSALARTDWISVDQAKGYIFRSAINRWRDLRRRRISHGAVLEWDEDAALAVGEGISPERVLLVEDELRRVATALQELQERTRDVFMLHRLERMTYAEIAEAFSISVSAVEKHMIRALAHVARCFRDEST